MLTQIFLKKKSSTKLTMQSPYLLAYINKKETEQLQETKRKKKKESKNIVRIEFEILLSETVMEKIRLDVLVVDRTHDERGQWAEQASTRMLAPSLFEPYDGSLRLHRMLYFRCMSTSTQNLLQRCHECYKDCTKHYYSSD